MHESSGSRERGGRPRASWGTVSREKLVEAATEEIAAGRYAQLTIRSLAAKLGVAPMTLYRHIRDKEDLLIEAVDRLLARVWEPATAAADTWSWLIEAADRFRQLLVDQPAALRVFLARPVTTPAAMARLRAMLGVLQAAGLDEESARRVLAAIHTYTLGFAALEASRARWRASNPEPADPDVAWLASLTSHEQFGDGLRALLAGGNFPRPGYVGTA